MSVPECSHKCSEGGKCLTERENGKYHRISVLLQQMSFVNCDGGAAVDYLHLLFIFSNFISICHFFFISFLLPSPPSTQN